MIPQLDTFCQIIVRQNDLTEQELAVHGAQGVHQIEGIGIELVDSLNQTNQLLIGITGGSHRLHEEFIAFLLDHFAIAEGLINFLRVESQSNSAQSAFYRVGERSGIYFLFPNGDHRHKEGVTVFRQQSVDFLHAVKQGLIFAFGLFRQKAAFHNVHTGFGKAVEHIADCLPAEFPLIDVSTVPQGTVEKFNLAHACSPLLINRLNTMSATSKSKGSLISQASMSLTGIRKGLSPVRRFCSMSSSFL